MMKKIVILITLLMPTALRAQQNYEKEYEALFAWEVKQIDEFTERFNNSDKTLIKQYNQKHNGVLLTRNKLIKSLFNAESKDWNFDDIKSFISEVDNETSPQYLDLEKDNWYANVTCSVVWKGKPSTVLLKLRLQKLAENGFKWVIADVKFLDVTDIRAEQPILPIPPDPKMTLNPISHTTDFLNIDMVTKKPQNIGNYLRPGNDYSNDLCLFVNECLENRLKILSANSITYSFFQIKGWDIEIQQYNRATKNSGWLISKLIKLPS